MNGMVLTATSKMEKLLITGGSGFVGKNLASFFATRCSVVSTHFQHPPAPTAESLHLDVTNAEEVFSVFNRVGPTAVIHAAGNKNVRFCEDHPEEAHRINALGTQNIARACRQLGAHLTYLSTDLVFEGVRGDYQEDELPHPTSAYGRSKLEGETFAREELADVAICRSGGIYGKGSPLLGWFLAEIDAGRTVECFVDVFNTPTYAENLAEMIETVIRKRLGGVFHTVGRDRVSRFEFFKAYANSLGLEGDLLSPISIAQMEEALPLQPDSSLSSKQTFKQLGVNFNSVVEGFERLKANGGV